MNVLKKFGKIANHQVFFWRINEKKRGGEGEREDFSSTAQVEDAEEVCVLIRIGGTSTCAHRGYAI
jgi:hypothetical protein